MSTVLPCPALRGMWADSLFNVGGATYLTSGNPDLIYAYFTSTDLMSWTGVGVLPGLTSMDQSRYFDGKLFVWDGSNVAYSTNNGATWTETGQLGTSTQIAPLIEVGGALFGLRRSATRPYLLTSSDGITINQAMTDLLPNGAYWNLVSFNGVLYALPDEIVTTPNRPIYTSANGINWTPVAGNWSIGVHAYGWFEFDGRFYVVGGVNGSSVFLDTVYSTADMITWTAEAYSSRFPARAKPAAAIVSGVPHVLGGTSSVELFDVWKLRGSSGSVPSNAL